MQHQRTVARCAHVLISLSLVFVCSGFLNKKKEQSEEDASRVIKTRMLGEKEWRTVPAESFSNSETEQSEPAVNAEGAQEQQPDEIVTPATDDATEIPAPLPEETVEKSRAEKQPQPVVDKRPEGWVAVAASDAFEAADIDDDRDLSRREKKKLEKAQKKEAKAESGSGLFGRALRGGDQSVKQVAREWHDAQPEEQANRGAPPLASMSPCRTTTERNCPGTGSVVLTGRIKRQSERERDIATPRTTTRFRLRIADRR